MKHTKTTRRLFLRNGLIWTLGAPLVVGTLATKVKAAPSIYDFYPQSCQAGSESFGFGISASGIEWIYGPTILWDGLNIGSRYDGETQIGGSVSSGLVLQPGDHEIKIGYAYGSSEVSNTVIFTVYS